jgi:O-antigen/teichoic acid export membrane protein
MTGTKPSVAVEIGATRPSWAMADGAARSLLAQSLLVPTGVITVAFLTRRLGSHDYGLYTLVAQMVAWLGSAVSAVLGAAAVTAVSRASDWAPVATTVLRVNLLLGLGLAAAIGLGAEVIAGLMHEPALAFFLRIYVIQLVVLLCARALRQILIARGRYRLRAGASAIYWISKLLFIVLLVEAGLSISGALLGGVAASLLELVIYWGACRINPFVGPAVPLRPLLTAVAPIIVVSLLTGALSNTDVFVLKLFGASAEDVGCFGAAKNLCLMIRLCTLSLAPLVLSSLMRLVRDGSSAQAVQLARDSQRSVLLLLPFAAMVAGAAPEVVALLFGSEFAAAAGVLGPLLVAELALFMLTVSTMILLAARCEAWLVRQATLLAVLALVGYAVVVPDHGAVGAAAVTAAVACLGAAAATARAAREWPGSAPIATLVRCLLLGAVGYSVAALWAAPGFWVIGKLLMLCLGVLLAFSLSGELAGRERKLLRSLLRRE